MPHILLYVTTDLWPARDRLVRALDARLSTSGDFDTSLCKYRLLEIEEYVVAAAFPDAPRHPEGADRPLCGSTAVRCEVLTFHDRSQDACARISNLCREALEDALTAYPPLVQPVEVSVAILQTDRASYRRTSFEGSR